MLTNQTVRNRRGSPTLEELGWQVNASVVRELFERYRIEHKEDEMTAKFADFQYVSATLG